MAERTHPDSVSVKPEERHVRIPITFELTDIVLLGGAIIDGLLLGGIYALAALGISLTFSVTNLLNLAHGNLIMMGAVVTFVFYSLLGGSAVGPVALSATLLLVLLAFAALGAAIEYGLVRPILKNFSDILISGILVTVGLALVLQDVGAYILVKDPANFSRSTTISLTLPFINSVVVGGYYLASAKLFSMIVILAASAGLYLFFKRTYLGMAMRSISQDRDAATIVGVNLRRISVITFAIGTLFAGFAGFILVIDQTADPSLGLGYTIKLLTIMVLGGVRSPLGPVAGGLLLGVIELLVASVFGAYWVSAVSLIILISILLISPTGLTGSRIR
jgi:branched-chain amino acid transport system permease protein